MASADHGEQAPDSDQDLKLLRLAQQGDDAAFEELMSRYSDLFHALAFFLVGRSGDAEDVVQETFLAAYEGLGSFKGWSSVKTWLSGILSKRAALCHWRNRRPGQGLRLSEPARALLNGNSTPALTAASEIKMDVMAALQTLQPEHREIVVLRELEGMSYREIAETLNLPAGTVESRLFRARQELKMRLREYGE